MSGNIIGLIIIMGLLVAIVATFINMLILALYYSVFKRARLYFQVKKELKRVLKYDAVLESSGEEEPMAWQNCEDRRKELCEDYNDDEVLTMKSATALLKSLGWLIKPEEKGDYLATYYLPDREVQFLYNDEKVKDCPQFNCGLLITTGIFAAACQTIDPFNSRLLLAIQLDFVAKGLEIFEERVRVGRLKQALEEALERAGGDFGFYELLRSQYATPPWEKDATFLEEGKAKGVSYALLHLGALALLGDVETLLSYSKSFAQGNRLGFEHDIEEIHLERAMAMAKEAAKTKHLSYDLLERVAESLSMKVESYQCFRAKDSQLCNKNRALHENG